MNFITEILVIMEMKGKWICWNFLFITQNKFQMTIYITNMKIE